MREFAKYPITDDEIIEGLTRLIDDLAAKSMPGDMRTTLLRAALERVRRHPTAPAAIGENVAQAAGSTPGEVDRAAKALVRSGRLTFRDAIRLLMARRMADHVQALRMTEREDDLARLMMHLAEEVSEGRVPEAIAFGLVAAGVDPTGEAVTDGLLDAVLRSGGSWPQESVMRAARRLIQENDSGGPAVGA